MGSGGAIYLSKSVANISKSTFENNVALMFGGAIRSNNCFMNIEYSKFHNNGAFNKVLGMGGGLLLNGNSTLKISNVLFSKCDASRGGAIFTNFTTIIMSNSSMISNTGSAIYLSDGDILGINNSTFCNNSALRTGGAISCIGSYVVKMVNTKFVHNKAVESGGAIAVRVGVEVSKNKTMSNLTAHNCSFTDNSAHTGGAMFVFYSVFNITDSNFSHILATNGGAAGISFGYLAMTNCRINNNTARANGGVVDTVNGTLLMSNCLVYNNTANVNGGVVRSTGSKNFITTSVLKMNRAFGNGGAFSVRGGTMLWTNSWFVKNIAVVGGVLSASKKKLSLI